MSLLVLGQILGMMSFFIGVLAFTKKNDHDLRVTMALLFVCQTAHFYCMGSQTGVVTCLVSLIRTLISIRFRGTHLGVIFLAANLLFGIPNIHHWIDILPIIAACCGTFAVFFLAGVKMRIAFMCGAVLWIINNAYIGSIGGVLLEAMVLIANVITIYRIRKEG